MPPLAAVQQLSAVDVWGINAYRFDDFGDLFASYAAASTKPMFMAEWGADAFNALPHVNAYDPASQASKTHVATSLFQNGAKLLDLRCVLLPAAIGAGLGHVSTPA